MSYLAVHRKKTAVVTDRDVVRFIDQASIGIKYNEISAVKATGFRAWIEDQFTQPTYDIMDYATAYGTTNTGHPHGVQTPVYRAVMERNDQLRWRVFHALQNFFVINGGGYFGNSYGSRTIAEVYGNFRSLIEQQSREPVMGRWLTFYNSAKEANGVQPDENYAREIMQLFSIGLWELNNDGTRKTKGSLPADDLRYVPGSTEPVPTYTIADVRGLARVFTGWTGKDQTNLSIFPATVLPYQMSNYAPAHETGTKVFLGVTIPANTSADASLAIALDTLFNHPSMPPFFCKQMIQRLVTANPSPEYVARVSSAFIKDPLTGNRGELKAVWRAILLDPEARSIYESQKITFGKVREPILNRLGYIRTYAPGLDPAKEYVYGDNETQYAQAKTQHMCAAPSVFNHFRPSFTPQGNIPAGMVSPELQMYGENEAIMGAWGAWQAFNQQKVQSNSATETLWFNLTAEQALAATPSDMFDRIALTMNTTFTAARKTAILTAANAAFANPATATNYFTKPALSGIIVGLIAGSIERQVQK